MEFTKDMRKQFCLVKNGLSARTNLDQPPCQWHETNDTLLTTLREKTLKTMEAGWKGFGCHLLLVEFTTIIISSRSFVKKAIGR